MTADKIPKIDPEFRRLDQLMKSMLQQKTFAAAKQQQMHQQQNLKQNREVIVNGVKGLRSNRHRLD